MPAQESQQPVLMRTKNLKKWFPIRAGVLQRTVGWVKAVDGIDLEIRQGEILGLVGESGSGKSTAARTILQLYPPTDGSILVDGKDLTRLSEHELKGYRKQMQIIFQDPHASLNPRMTIERVIAEPLRIHAIGDKKERRERVHHWMARVGLDPSWSGRYPHQLSGGQRQRVGIARALVLEPSFVVADEPTSSLDVSVQAQVLSLMEALQAELNLTYLFITHDLSIVRYLCDRVAVMYLGKIVEVAPTEELFNSPLHPYTRALLSAVPVPDPELEAKRQRIILEGDIPSPASPPWGCNFNTRCPLAAERCFVEEPELRELRPDHWVACHFAGVGI